MDNSRIDVNDIIRTLTEYKDKLAEFSVKNIGLFGSFVRGEQNEHSDIDFLVEFEEPTLENYMRLSEFLENLFNRKIEILTPAGIESIRIKHIKEEIKRSVMYV